MRAHSRASKLAVVETMLVAALSYAERGIPVFPCDADKKPLIGAKKDADGKPIPKSGGFHRASHDEEQVREWWKRWPDAMIGMPTGPASGIDVLDIDAKNGVDGFAALPPDWEAQSDFVVRTPSGGAHLWFKSDGKLRNSAGKIAPGLDFRGDGGYVILPPSRPAGGAIIYRWERGSEKPLSELRPVPVDLRAQAERRGTNGERVDIVDGQHTPEGRRALERERAAVAGAKEGTRNSTLNTSAFKVGQMIGARALDEARARQSLGEAARAAGLEDNEIERTLDSGIEAGKKEPREPGAIISATPFELIDPARIPKRQWLYKPYYVRQFTSLTVSTGGVGKSSLAIVEGLAIASGRPLLGIEPKGHLRVWYWNGEDPPDELQRRIAAAAKHYELKPEDIGDRLFVDSGRRMPIVIAEDSRQGTRVAEPVIRDVIATLVENQIDVLAIDPFVSCHRVSENDNNAIERVAKSWSHVAEAANCAVMLVHHSRKTGGEAATVDDGRGASALLAAARTARTLNTMRTKEAEDAEIDERERRTYFRSDLGKANLTRPAESADWFRLVSVDLENVGDDDFGSGDEVGVVTPWDYPRIEVPMATALDIRRAQDAIRGDGRWRLDQRSKNEPWVGIPMASALGLDPNRKSDRRAIVAIVEEWLSAGFLRRVEGKDGRHEAHVYVEVGSEPGVDGPWGSNHAQD